MYDFSTALTYLKVGYKVSRKGWNGRGMWLVLAYQTRGFGEDDVVEFNKKYSGVSLNLGNFIAMKTVDDELVPWVASQTDLLAEDWVLVE